MTEAGIKAGIVFQNSRNSQAPNGIYISRKSHVLFSIDNKIVPP